MYNQKPNATLSGNNASYQIASLNSKNVEDDLTPSLGYSFIDDLGDAAGEVSGLGGVFTTIMGFFGNIFQEGWSLSCIGGQAYNKQDFAREMQEAKSIVDGTDTTNVLSIETLLNQMSWRTELDTFIANKYSSSCSKTLRLKRGKFCADAIAIVLPKVNYTGIPQLAPGENPYTYVRYSVQSIKENIQLPTSGGSVPSPNQNGGVTGGGMGDGTVGTGGGIIPDMAGGFNPNDYVDQNQGLLNAYQSLPLPDQVLLQSYANSNGKTLSEILNGYFSGQIRIVDGRVIWGVSAGSQNQDQTFNYVLLGGFGFLAYKMLKK